MRSSKRSNPYILLGLAATAFLFILVIGFFQPAPKPPVVVVVPTSTAVVAPTPKPAPVPVSEQALQPDKGWYGVLRFEGSGMSIVPDFTVPVSFKIIWRCKPIRSGFWLREAVYQTNGKEYSDIVNFTCTNKLTSAHGLATYPAGNYTIDVMSHVQQSWELLIEVKSMG